MKIIKNIFFDFDGVLAESVSAKTEAFRELYLPYGEDIANRVVEHHRYYGGVSRYDKFRIYHKEFLDKEISELQVQLLAQQFSDLVLQKVIISDEVPGATKFIEAYSKSLNFWIITGTPTSEMEIIAKERNITPYFIGLHGSPEKKNHWTELLINKHHLKRDETIFLGDAMTDYKAAQYSNIHFSLREHEENKEIFKEYEGMRFKGFDDFEKQIKPYL